MILLKLYDEESFLSTPSEDDDFFAGYAEE